MRGRRDEARRGYAVYRELDPEVTLSDLPRRFNFRRPEHLQIFVDAMTLIGMPA